MKKINFFFPFPIDFGRREFSGEINLDGERDGKKKFGLGPLQTVRVGVTTCLQVRRCFYIRDTWRTLRDFGVSLSEIYTRCRLVDSLVQTYQHCLNLFYLTRFIFVFGFTDNDRSNYFIVSIFSPT